ncbi:hypothetical protein [Pseudonocardia alni]|uniref:hypothetical protein n=1 Tax=Pseudonocardia alni TaxID=33907 RepID=UPI002798EB5E|nr:hypothetical protein PaSha_17225 [Pseudonocardia alni]
MSVTPEITPATRIPAIAVPAPRLSTEDGDAPPPVADTPATQDPTEDRTGGAPAEPCRCGHGRDAHEHYRRGTECGVCGTVCPAYRARNSGLRRAVQWALRRS